MTQRFPFTIAYRSGGRDPAVNLRAGRHFRFDFDAANNSFLSDLPAVLVDLLRIASAIYVVDRLIKRRLGNRCKPARTIDLQVEVLKAAYWNRSELRDTIREALDFVSGDFWDIAFVQDKSDFRRVKQFLPNPPDVPPPLMCLYSGGLDSAAGLASRISENTMRPIIPVSVWHQPRQKHWLLKQHALLRERFGSQIDPLIVKVAMVWSSDLNKKHEEGSQRCRSFLFAALGAIAAIMQGQSSVEMFESGVGAINQPLMADMVGWKATKGSHPAFLRLMSRLASHIAGSNFEFRLPFFNQTKGELVTRLAELKLEQLARMTASCVAYPLRHSRSSPAKQCGICPACIFRRQAMQVAAISEGVEVYEHNIFKLLPESAAMPAERLKFLKAFLMQVAQLKDVERNERLPGAFERHVISTGILMQGQSQKGVIELLARYRDEWIAVASQARRSGLGWATWLAPQQPQERLEQGVIYASA